ncbi:hypothetical protein Taro_003088 [Colocasia esculenta]|uniref:Uncharacterized protein n=1 Tax=Colocasia esculenta TaxID=4460 RepID=A0A843TIU4_COLES|nr:hypothetical protein [Colocasia esculenta]
MGFRLEGDQVRTGPAVVEAPVAPEVVAPPPEVPAQEDQPPANEDQPPVEHEVQVPQDAPITPQFQPSSPLNPEVDIPSFPPQPEAQASTSFGGPFVPPELYSFLNDKFDTITSSIQQMSEAFELRVQRLENSVSAQFIKQKEAADYAAQRFNRLIGTLADASLELKEHQDKLEKVLEGILANSQQNLFNIQEAVNQISKTRLSFAHMVDDLEGMKNLSAHIDEEMSALKEEFKSLHSRGGTAGSSSSSQPISIDFSVLQATMRGGAPGHEDEPRRDERAEQQAPAPQGPVLPLPPPVDYGVFMQGLVQAMQTQAHTQAALQAQLEAQAQVPAQDHGGPSTMERFKRMLPPSFKGERDSLLAESWMREIEKIF